MSTKSKATGILKKNNHAKDETTSGKKILSPVKSLLLGKVSNLVGQGITGISTFLSIWQDESVYLKC